MPTSFKSSPPSLRRVEYSLTALGDKVASTLLDLITLAEDSLPQILAAQRDIDDERAPTATAQA